MVNTFLPYPTFQQCAEVLDNKRLGKQRVEAYQVIRILTGATKKLGWRNHPLTLLWKGNVDALKLYYNTIVEEWIKRGFKNNMKLYKISPYIEVPWFAKNININYSHQASLIRKYPEYYGKIFTPPPVFLEYKYIWPKDLTDAQISELKSSASTVADISKYAKPVNWEEIDETTIKLIKKIKENLIANIQPKYSYETLTALRAINHSESY